MEFFISFVDVDFVDILEAYQERSSTIPMVAWLARRFHFFSSNYLKELYFSLMAHFN